MKALVLEEHKRLVYQDVPEPGLGPGEVLIAVRTTCRMTGRHHVTHAPLHQEAWQRLRGGQCGRRRSKQES